MNTENTINTDKDGTRGWVLYDADCPFCTNLARRFESILRRYRFCLAPLQTPWVRRRLGLLRGQQHTEMRLLTASGRIHGGAEAIVQIVRSIWWAWPLYALARIPWVHWVLRAGYRWMAERRSCFGGACQLRRPSR